MWSSARGRLKQPFPQGADECYALSPNVVPLDRSYYERRDQMAFEMAKSGDVAARGALLRIVQRHPNEEKRQHAQALLPDILSH